MTSVFLNSVMTLGISILSLSQVSIQAQASSTKFVCQATKGTPITLAQVDTQHVPIVKWLSDYFSNDGWTPQTRCQEVSKRFEKYYNNGSLKFLTTGRINRLPVICTARYKGGSCENLLLTLKPGTNSTATLKNLLQVKNRERGPLNETAGRVYIDFEELIKRNKKANYIDK